MIGLGGHPQRFFRHLDVEPVPAHGFNMLRPLIDQAHILTGVNQIGGDATAVGAGAEHRNSVNH